MGNLDRLVRNKDAGIAFSALLLFVGFSLSSESFLSAYNLFNISRIIAFSAFVALAQAVVLVAGGMNLSVGAIGGLATIATGYGIQVLGLPGWLAGSLALAIGCTAGLLNGLIITRLKINSFVTTLATLFVFTGLVHGFSEGYAYTEIPRGFTFLGRQKFLGLSNLFWVMALVLLVTHYMFRHTVFGRRLLATGGNLEAARLSGINTDRMLLSSHILSGGLAALAAVLWVSRMGSAQPATGKDFIHPQYPGILCRKPRSDGNYQHEKNCDGKRIIMQLVRTPQAGRIIKPQNVHEAIEQSGKKDQHHTLWLLISRDVRHTYPATDSPPPPTR